MGFKRNRTSGFSDSSDIISMAPYPNIVHFSSGKTVGKKNELSGNKGTPLRPVVFNGNNSMKGVSRNASVITDYNDFDIEVSGTKISDSYKTLYSLGDSDGANYGIIIRFLPIASGCEEVVLFANDASTATFNLPQATYNTPYKIRVIKRLTSVQILVNDLIVVDTTYTKQMKVLTTPKDFLMSRGGLSQQMDGYLFYAKLNGEVIAPMKTYASLAHTTIIGDRGSLIDMSNTHAAAYVESDHGFPLWNRNGGLVATGTQLFSAGGAAIPVGQIVPGERDKKGVLTRKAVCYDAGGLKPFVTTNGKIAVHPTRSDVGGWFRFETTDMDVIKASHESLKPWEKVPYQKGGSYYFLKDMLGSYGNFHVETPATWPTGWENGSIFSIACSNNILTFTPTAQYGNVRCIRTEQSYQNTDAIFACAFVKSTLPTTYLQISSLSGSRATHFHSGNGKYELLGRTATFGNINGEINISSTATSGWTPISVKQAHMFNLTKIFGAGNEPTEAEMLAWIKTFGEYVPSVLYDHTSLHAAATKQTLLSSVRGNYGNQFFFGRNKVGNLTSISIFPRPVPGGESRKLEKSVAFDITGYARAADCDLLWMASKFNGQKAGDNTNFSRIWKDMSGKSYSRTLVNLLGNYGNMSDTNADGLADGFQTYMSNAISCINNEQTFIATGQFGQVFYNVAGSVGDILYGCAFIKSTRNVATMCITNNVSGAIVTTHSGSGQYEFKSTTAKKSASGLSGVTVYDSATSAWDAIAVKQMFALNLTAIFGVGNEPTKEWMDITMQTLIAKQGYFTQAKITHGNEGVLMNFAQNTSDGWNKLMVPSRNGTFLDIVNLLGNEGNMLDSNANNQADGWVYGACTSITVNSNETTFTPTVQYGGMNKTSEVRAQSVNDVLYFCANVKSTLSSTRIFYETDGNGQVSKFHSGLGVYELLSVSGKLAAKTSSYVSVHTTAASGWTSVSVKQAFLINLTQLFGVGKEPTTYQMDVLMRAVIAKHGYFSAKRLRYSLKDALYFDGINSVITTASNTDLNPIATTGDFGIGVTFATPATFSINGYLFCKNASTSGDVQIGIFADVTNKYFSIWINGIGAITTAAYTLTPATLYNIKVKRYNGYLSMEINDVQTNRVANTTVASIAPWIRVGGRSNAVDGSTSTINYTGYIINLIVCGENSTEAAFDTLCDKVFYDYQVEQYTGTFIDDVLCDDAAYIMD